MCFNRNYRCKKRLFVIQYIHFQIQNIIVTLKAKTVYVAFLNTPQSVKSRQVFPFWHHKNPLLPDDRFSRGDR